MLAVTSKNIFPRKQKKKSGAFEAPGFLIYVENFLLNQNNL